MTVLPYDPGPLPTLPAPAQGEVLELAVDGYPPFKDVKQSIRNRKHPCHADFKTLRNAAIKAMAGRAWYFGPVGLDLTLYAPSLPRNRNLLDYVGGVMDTLDGSSGCTFTFLPVVYEDDCQVALGNMQLIESKDVRYTLKITFLGERPAN
jgi:hypothetical protein